MLSEGRASLFDNTKHLLTNWTQNHNQQFRVLVRPHQRTKTRAQTYPPQTSPQICIFSLLIWFFEAYYRRQNLCCPRFAYFRSRSRYFVDLEFIGLNFRHFLFNFAHPAKIYLH
jgi:hypothetical protein